MCLSDGVENANTKLYTSFWKTSQTLPTSPSKKFISQLVIQDETFIYNFVSESEQQSMQWNEQIGQDCHFFTLRNSCFSMSNANNRLPFMARRRNSPTAVMMAVV